MAILTIPTRKDLFAYSLDVTLEGTTYRFEFKFNSRKERWSFDIQDQAGNDILVGIPALTNVDLTAQYQHLGIPKGIFLFFDTEGEEKNAGQFELGDRIKMLYEETE
jgi:hypothetical protein